MRHNGTSMKVSLKRICLQVCYINDLQDDEEDDNSDDGDGDDFAMPKSKSAPNLQCHVHDGSNLSASQLRQAARLQNKFIGIVIGISC